jgi:hypothetical protein
LNEPQLDTVVSAGQTAKPTRACGPNWGYYNARVVDQPSEFGGADAPFEYESAKMGIKRSATDCF